MITPLGGPANSTRERDVSISLGTYSVAVHADVRLGRSGEILLSNWRAQFFDFYDFNIGASAPISFPASSLNSVERVVINAVVRNAMPGNPGLVPQYSGRRLTGYTISLPDAYFAALANSGYAHNYPVRSTVFSPRDTPGVIAPAFVR